MPLIASAKIGGDFKPCPAGLHHAICAFVEDLGLEFSDAFQKEVHKIVICWEVNTPMSDGRPYMISQRYTLSLSEKANLRKVLECWRGKAFTDQELEGFDVEKVKGKQCMLQIMHNTKGGKTYANIAAVLPAILPPAAGGIKLSVVNTEAPDWIAKVRDENAAAHAKLEAAPVVVTGLEEGKPKVPAAAGEETVPF